MTFVTTEPIDPTPAPEPAPAARFSAQFQLLVDDQAWCWTRGIAAFWGMGAVAIVVAR